MYFPISQDAVMYATTFIFVFALIYGLLDLVARKKGGFFPKRSNILIALAFALISIAYTPVISFIWSLLPIASVILIVLFFVAFVIKIFESDQQKKTDYKPMMVVMVLLLIVIGSSWDKISAMIPFGMSSDMLWLIGLVVVGLLFYGAYKSGEE